jgi:predicted small metal-binding protein
MKEVHCSEVGLFPDCDGVMRGETEEEVMAACAQHGREVHGESDADFTEIIATVRSHIRDT